MRALPNSHLNLRDASDFILTSRLGRKALAEKYEPVPNFTGVKCRHQYQLQKFLFSFLQPLFLQPSRVLKLPSLAEPVNNFEKRGSKWPEI